MGVSAGAGADAIRPPLLHTTLLPQFLRLSVEHVHVQLSGNQWDIFFPPPHPPTQP